MCNERSGASRWLRIADLRTLFKNVSLVVPTIFRTLPLTISSLASVDTVHPTSRQTDSTCSARPLQRALLLVVRSDLASFRLSFVQDCLLRPLGGVALCHIKMIQQPQVIGRFKPLKHVITLRLCRPIAYVNVHKLQFAESLFACSVRLS